MPSVDFVTNVFERTYREVLRPGQIRRMAESHLFPFDKVILLINNVTERAVAQQMAEGLVENGEITTYHFVADLLEGTLSKAGLTKLEITETIHYTDCSLVAVFLPDSPYLVYSDADIVLKEPADWISPGLAIMDEDKRIAVVNPDWNHSTLNAEAREFRDDFGIGYGFSDQLYLIQRKEFARPIYRYRAPVSMRYPLSYLSPVFEQSVDSYMRVHGRLRATYKPVVYIHQAEEGVTYRKKRFAAKLKCFLLGRFVQICQLIPGRNPRYHL